MKPTCPVCGKPIDRFQRTAPKNPGVVASYPCNCWHSEQQAKTVVDSWKSAVR